MTEIMSEATKETDRCLDQDYTSQLKSGQYLIHVFLSLTSAKHSPVFIASSHELTKSPLLEISYELHASFA